jgi:hypothetical protein
MERALTTLFENIYTPTGGVFVLSMAILFLGMLFIPKIGKDSPFASQAIQVLAIMLLVPAAMYLGVTKTINAEAVTGIFGGIAGYVFARAGGQ